MNEELKEASGQKRIQRSKFLEAVAAANVFLPVVIVCFSVAGFAFGVRMHGWILPAAALVTFFGLRLFTGSWRMTGFAAGISIGIIVIAFLLASHTYDNSYDGLDYHQNAVLCLSKGWNPFFESSESYGGYHDDLWDDHYPKAAWITGAAFFLDSGQIEAGKLLNFSLMAAAMAQLAAVLLRLTLLRAGTVIFLAALAALNPIAICQSTTFYIDGLMASLLTIGVSALVLYVAQPQWPTLSIGLAAICLAANVKFTGLIYAVVLVGCFFAINFWRNGTRTGWRVAIAAAAAGLFATCVFGYSPYVRNLTQNGNVFYPVLGSHNLFHKDDYVPVNLAPHNRVMRFLISNFSRSERVRPPHSTTLKIPFLISTPWEGSPFLDTDVEAGGFGPLFGGMLLVGVIGLILLAADRSAWKPLSVAIIIGGVILLSIFSHTETWWSRYVPQAWLLPILIAAVCLAAPQRLGRRWIGWALIVLMSVNVLFVGFYFLRGQLRYVGATRKTLREMAAAPQPTKVYFGRFPSLGERLREAGVQFQIVSMPPTAGQGAAGWKSIPCPMDACWTTGP